MKKFKRGEFEINIDEIATKQYFENAELRDTQFNKNFQKYAAEEMTDEEKIFFDSICVNLKKLDLNWGYLTLEKKWACDIDAYVIGDFVSYPETKVITIDDVAEQGFDILENRKNNDFTVGNFIVKIYTPNQWVPGSDMPENTIDIRICSTELPWLLDEKCEDREKRELPQFLIKIQNFLFDIRRFTDRLKDKRITEEKLNKELEKLKNDYDIGYKILTARATRKYRKAWINRWLPRNITKDERKEAYRGCYKDGSTEQYLWNIFGFGYIESAENASEAFGKIQIENCMLVFASYRPIAVKLTGAGKLSEDDVISFCKNVSGWCDFVITADDFSWVYSRTHEDGWCGPYFYQNQMNE